MVIPVRAGWGTAASSEPSQTMSSPRPLQFAPGSSPRYPPTLPCAPFFESLPCPEPGARNPRKAKLLNHPGSTSGYYRS